MGSVRTLLLAGLSGVALAGCHAAAPTDPPHVAAADPVAAGRYLVTVGGCNDCHTPGWAETAGATPEKAWLTGAPVAWVGPWGATYPANLRLVAQHVTEDEWVAMLKTRTARPPMPWMNVNRMPDSDTRALYRFIRSLGPAGVPAPAALAPGQTPATPFIRMAPEAPKLASRVRLRVEG
ncbi:MAG TPA: cytochrome C [Caulobacteraceae bacterium]|nr:cytochrome C [Caulobacteraceae bacterium]